VISLFDTDGTFLLNASISWFVSDLKSSIVSNGRPIDFCAAFCNFSMSPFLAVACDFRLSAEYNALYSSSNLVSFSPIAHEVGVVSFLWNAVTDTSSSAVPSFPSICDAFSL